MNDTGILTLSFNQNLVVPDFALVALNLSNDNITNLSSYYPKNISTNESIQDILSLKNIIQFQLISNS